MADVTISQLNTVNPLGSHVLPYSNYISTNSAIISSLPVDYSSVTNRPYSALLTYDVPSGVTGGAAQAGVWSSRFLNTIVYNQNNIVKSLIDPGGGTRRWFLDPGNYILEAAGSFWGNNNIQVNCMHRIIKVTPSITSVARGISNRVHLAPGSSSSLTNIIPPTQITIQENSSFELQYFFSSVRGQPTDLGWPVSSGEPERYAYVYITKV